LKSAETVKMPKKNSRNNLNKTNTSNNTVNNSGKNIPIENKSTNEVKDSSVISKIKSI
jgi:hypothetical protein